jgi:hypothetical protein
MATLSDLTDRAAVLQAIAEHDELGRETFLSRYGYGAARSYFLVHDGKRYDSKAIAGVAVGKQFPASGAMAHSDFSGGEATVEAKLKSLGFRVVHSDAETEGVSAKPREASGRGCRLLACTLGGRLLGRSFHAYLTTKAE